ncbi:MAG: hypothetical protein MJ197_09115 [Bacteroidales bacterium]|nr:hypothetical protein [Bacteroidales bacterium]
MKKIAILIVMTIAALSLNAQDLNYMDANGKKQGKWLVKYPNGNMKMEGYFKNNTPVGTLKKYHENGLLKYEMIYDAKDTNSVQVTMYDASGELSAKGAYYAKKKNGLWQYFGDNNKVIMEESYNHGKLNGKSVVYWQNQENQPMEIKNWKDSVKDGDWIWFYEDGKIRQKARYKEDKLDGEFKVFFADGICHIDGKYADNVRDGLWQYFKEDGSLKLKIEYNKGKIVNEDEYERAETKMIDEEILGQEGKHIDPQDYLDNPEAYIFGSQRDEEAAPAPKAKKKKEKTKK